MAFTPFVSGQTLTAALLNAAFRAVGVVTAYKAADGTAITANITPAADPDLACAIEANRVYAMVMWLNWASTSNTPDIRIDFTGSATTTMRRSFIAQTTAATTTTSGPIDFGVSSAIGNDDTRGAINGDSSGLVFGHVTVGATAGTLQLRVAQATSDAASLTVKSGSWMVLIPLN